MNQSLDWECCVSSANPAVSLPVFSCIQGQNKSGVLGEGISWPLVENKIDMQLTCCMDCSTNCHQEARSLTGLYRNNQSTTTTTTTSPTTSTTSSLPSWLQKCKEESREISTDHQVGSQLFTIYKCSFLLS